MTPRVHRYARLAAAQFGVTAADLLGRSRLRQVYRARRMVMHRLYADGFSLTQIGKWLGRDHSTVGHALNVMGRPEQKVRELAIPAPTPPRKPARDSIAYNRQRELSRAQKGCRDLLRAHLTVPRSHWISDPAMLVAAKQAAGLPA